MNIKDITPEKLMDALKANMDKAQDYLDDDVKMEKLFRDFEDKLKLVPKIGDKLADIAIMASMVRAYAKKQYTEVSVATILLAIAAVIYVVAPIDLIPDAIPVVGFLDDAGAVVLVLSMIDSDLQKYVEWQKEQGIRE